MRLVLVAISLMFIRWSMLQIYAKYLVRATFLSPLASKRLLCSVDSPCASTFYFSVRSFNVFLIFFWPIYVRRTTHLHLKIECCGDDYFFRFTFCYTFDFDWSVLSFLMIHNVHALGAGGDFTNVYTMIHVTNLCKIFGTCYFFIATGIQTLVM